jgi:hypothetical protein
VEGNLERALSEELRPGAERKLTGKEEALLVATACSNPPPGRARWTLELLAGEMVKLTGHERLSPKERRAFSRCRRRRRPDRDHREGTMNEKRKRLLIELENIVAFRDKDGKTIKTKQWTLACRRTQ